ncbi:GSCOCG00010794001-RA-CDS [Cotesia congregata]|nr:GSCOCG00010794001-RA-CDS [Cotesia congregata]
MILLKDNIYCTKTAFEDAVDFSRKSATSFLRRLMNGVFKRNAILNCTYSGRPPNAQGKTKQSQKVEPLDRNAKKAVLEFCTEYATTKGWLASTDAKLRKAMTQWVGEVKRENKKNKKS